ncbi:MAG: sigma factor-like helix-turn-helix DNA-binding protein [Lachnospiraceae bacterium]
MDSIEYMYKDPQFEAVLFYLKANGILEISELQGFDFRELMFVPGISPELVKDAEKLYEKMLELNMNSGSTKVFEENTFDNEPEYNSSATENPVDSDKESRIFFPEPESNYSDIQIVDVYAGIPRGSLFINWCSMHDKRFMHQLCDSDFETAKTIKGLGLASVENLRRIFENFTVSEQAGLVQQNSKSIENIFMKLPYGNTFCDYCRTAGFFVLSDLINFSFDHKEIKGIGLSSMERLRQAYLNAVMQDDAPPLEPSKFSDIPLINYGIPISHKALNAEGFKYIGDICRRGLPIRLYIQIKSWLEPYKTSITNIFINELFKLKENVNFCLTMRSKTQTLQQIADNIGITRERVRQIVAKAVKTLTPIVAILADAILYSGKQFFRFNDLVDAFQDSLYAEVYRFIIKQAEDYSGIVYLDFADKFVKGPFKKHEYEEFLRQIAEEEIGEGINFFDNLERIDAQLKEKNIPALDFEDLMNFLVKSGYHFYGDYVMRGRQSYAIVCADAVRKFFPYGIKLNNEENNEDLACLRKVVARHYSGLELPENNHALSSRMVSVLIQSGKAQYCHIDSVVYSIALFDEIYDYMQNSPQRSFHYSELFELFKGRLLAETNITEYNFLHGMLKYLFSEDFDFSDRDVVTKLGASKQNSDDRIKELLLSNGAPLSKKDIKKAFRGINDFVIAFSVSREEKLIPWDYNMYNHVDNLDINDNDISRLSSIVGQNIKIHKGYLSDNLLYDIVKIEYPLFLDKNKMKNELNLYNTVAYLFKDLYRFRRPHILSLDINIKDLSLINIAKYLLNCRYGLNYKEYISLASKFGWANGTLYLIFSELEKEFIRISEDDYVIKERFTFEQRFLDDFKLEINSLLKESGYFAMFDFFTFQGYPYCEFEWNGFLIESIIEECDVGYKILSPQVKDRRYQRGIVVVENHPSNSFEELVAHIMKKDHIMSLNESEFSDYLKQKGLVYNTIPQELYNCSEITFKNELFGIVGR